MIVFAGPTLNDVSHNLCQDLQFDLRDPVQRGDILRLTAESSPGEILIVDGVFHQHLSVGHEEILDAIQAGWKIHGVSSMGAIRAYELRDHGMLGHGMVYHRFLSTNDFQDDEVALLHLPAPDFTNMSEPFVHFRACLEFLKKENFVSAEHCDRIIQHFKNQYFGDRTMWAFESYFKEIVGQDFKTIVPNFDVFREKQIDLIHFLEMRRDEKMIDKTSLF
jgi:hypothetical protein